MAACSAEYDAAFSGVVMKVFLNVFRQFGEVNLRDSRVCFHDDAIGFDARDRGIFVFFAVNRFEVFGECGSRER